MDEKNLESILAEELVRGWQVIPTGSGMLIATDWLLPDDERIEIQIRTVGERDDLYIVTDGGELFNLLFVQGIDLSKDETSEKILDGIAQKYAAKFVDFQLVKGASELDLPRALRLLLEAIKEASFVLWQLGKQRKDLH